MGECFQAIAANVAPLPSLIAWDPAHGKSLRFLGCDGYGELVQTPLFVALFVRHKVSGRGRVGTAFQAGRPKGAKRPLLDFSAGLKASTPTPAYCTSPLLDLRIWEQRAESFDCSLCARPAPLAWPQFNPLPFKAEAP